MDLIRTEHEESQVPDVWLTAIMVFVVIAYGWMASVALEPKPRLPNQAVSYLGWIEGSKLKDWREVQKPRSLQFARITREIRKIENDLNLLGGFQEAPSLFIVVDDPNRYVVADTRIELSESIAMAEGQLRKAFIKSWLLQTQPKDAIAARSLLRLEVVSDVLAAMLSSKSWFENPVVDGRIEIPAPKAWIRFAGSLNALCGSPWTSLDLQGRCVQSSSLHPLTFRPLLAGMIWSVYKEMPPLRRLMLIRAWAEELLTSRGDESLNSVIPTELADWRRWLEVEFRKIFPVDSIAARAAFSELERERLSLAANRVEAESGLTESGRTEIQYVFFSDRPLPESAQIRALGSYVIIEKSGQARLYPGDVILDSADLKQLSTPFFVWESCKEPKVGELLDHPVQAKRYFVVYSCDEGNQLASWARLARRGLAGFIKVRPEARFMQLHREHLELAIRHGVISKRSVLSRIKEGTRASEFLGLEKPTWRGDVGAFQVLGAIEAIEWFRSSGS